MTSKLRNLIDRLRLERRARITVEKAQAQQALLRRLSDDGLDPEDPNDRLAMNVLEKARKQREEAKAAHRKAQIKQIAYRLMEDKLGAITLIPSSKDQPLQFRTIAENAYKKATIIFDQIELAAAKENL